MNVRIASEEILVDIGMLSELLAGAHDRDTIWQAASEALDRLVGHQLFTVLIYDGSSDDVLRAYSNQPDKYKISGRKQMGPTPWGTLVLKQGQPYLGSNADDIRWAFPDHELILSMGLESSLNLPIRYDGRTLGTLNLLHQAGHYRPEHITLVKLIAPLLIAPCLEMISEWHDG